MTFGSLTSGWRALILHALAYAVALFVFSLAFGTRFPLAAIAAAFAISVAIHAIALFANVSTQGAIARVLSVPRQVGGALLPLGFPIAILFLFMSRGLSFPLQFVSGMLVLVVVRALITREAKQAASCRLAQCAGNERGCYAFNLRDRTSEHGSRKLVPRKIELVTAAMPPMNMPGYWGRNDITTLENLRKDPPIEISFSGHGPSSPPLKESWRDPLRWIFCSRYWRPG